MDLETESRIGKIYFFINKQGTFLPSLFLAKCNNSITLPLVTSHGFVNVYTSFNACAVWNQKSKNQLSIQNRVYHQ